MKKMDEKIKTWVTPILQKDGYELYDFKLRGNRSNAVMQFFIDREDGITIDDCVNVSKKLSDLLTMHEEELNLQSFRFEVSSPGIDRSLKKENNFRKSEGMNVIVIYNRNNIKSKIEGKILKADPETVTIQTGNDTIRLFYSEIINANIKSRW